MCASKPEMRAISSRVRCGILIIGVVCAATVLADEAESTIDDLEQPLCRRNHAPPSATGWRLNADGRWLQRASRKLELSAPYSLQDMQDFSRAFSWSTTEEFRFDRELNEWYRLRVYGSRNAVRVITLWDSEHTTLALQTDKRGDPMLRWTSKELSRGEASRGLLDGWLVPREVE